jgi:proteasome accessory factor C
MAAKATGAQRARRLLALLPHLEAGRTLAIPELASAVGATTEELFDDLVLLSMCGVPPYSPESLVGMFPDDETLTVEAWAEPPVAEPVRLSAAEARALAAALQAAGRDEDDPLTRAVLASAGPSVDPEALARVVRSAVSPGGLAEIHATLARALREHEAVRISYFSASRDQLTERVVHPWALRALRGEWYVSAWCESAGAERVFRLDRIRSAEPAGHHFDPPASSASFAIGPDGSEGLPIAEVLIAAGAPVPDSREWPGALFERREDGSTLARVPYLSVGWVARRVVSRLGSAEALSPEEVRSAICSVAGDLHDRYM